MAHLALPSLALSYPHSHLTKGAPWRERKWMHSRASKTARSSKQVPVRKKNQESVARAGLGWDVEDVLMKREYTHSSRETGAIKQTTRHFVHEKTTEAKIFSGFYCSGIQEYEPQIRFSLPLMTRDRLTRLLGERGGLGAEVEKTLIAISNRSRILPPPRRARCVA